MRDTIALSMLDIVWKLNDKTTSTPYNPPELFYNVCTTETCKKFSLLEQEDARSLVIYILAHWAEGEQSWKISELYEGHIFSKIGCSNCSNTSWDVEACHTNNHIFTREIEMPIKGLLSHISFVSSRRMDIT